MKLISHFDDGQQSVGQDENEMLICGRGERTSRHGKGWIGEDSQRGHSQQHAAHLFDVLGMELQTTRAESADGDCDEWSQQQRAVAGIG